jgi:hypothetical protein
MTRPPRPRFVGVITHLDPHGRYQFRYPTGWHRFELEDNRDGVMYAPQADNPQTYVAVWVDRMETSIVADDLEDLRSGLDEGLATMPGFQLEAATDDIFGNMLRFERIYTYRDGDAIRKRKVWLIYADNLQFVVTYQGETPEEFEYWLPMGNTAFFSFNLPPELWFATDPTLTAPGSFVKVE